VLGAGAKSPTPVSIEHGTVNGQPGLLLYADGVLLGVCSFDVGAGQIQAVYVQVNPQKLPAPGPHGSATGES